MLVSEGFGVMLIYVGCIATWGSGGIQAQLLPRVVPGSLVQLQLGSILMAVSCVEDVNQKQFHLSLEL